ncbi:MAG: hypothetical protein ACRDAM_14895, partial [Casimicrobium sp.]
MNVSSLRWILFTLALGCACVHLRANAMGTTPARGVQMEYKLENENVRGEFLDEDNFRFVVDSGVSTVIRDGAIYLNVKLEGRPEQVLLLADREIRKNNKDKQAKAQRSPSAALPPAASVEPVKDAPR